MEIQEITAFCDRIELLLRAPVPGAVHVDVCLPLVCAEKGVTVRPGRVLLSWQGTGETGVLTLPRFAGEEDLLICRFDASEKGCPAAGVRYVSAFSPDFARGTDQPPRIARPIGTWCTASAEDVDRLRFGASMTEINMAWLLTLHPADDDIPHTWNGRTCYFIRERVQEQDEMLAPLARKGIPCLLRFINREHYRLRDADPELFGKICHPNCERDGEGVEISAFNLRTEEGLELFCACLDFLFERYAGTGGAHGWSTMLDLGNEVNSQRIWCNAGPAECADFMEEYAAALRLAWQLSRKYCPYYRVNISLEQNFARPYRPDPLFYYGARECLEQLEKICRRDGDFEWGVAAHPYPENLSFPDFYNDRTPTFSFDTPLVTLKNLEVWPALLATEAFLYRGRPRRVVFDEQGFNTRPDAPYTEEQGAFAFVLAWLKIRRQPAVEQLLIHRYIDIPFNEEYGLNLGLRRSLGYADPEHLREIPGPYKLICGAIEAMDSPEEEVWVRLARSYIGPALFDALLNPPEIEKGTGERFLSNFNV